MATIVVKTSDLQALEKAVKKAELTVGDVSTEYMVRIPIPPEMLGKYPLALLWQIRQVSGVSFACLEVPKRAKEAATPEGPTSVELQQEYIGDIL